MCALEGPESTLILASGMYASRVVLMALVPAGGYLVTTTDCYRKTRIFIETILPKMGILATSIYPVDVGALERALNENKVSGKICSRIFIETILPKMGIMATAIYPADVGALECARNENEVSLFFIESPTNPLLRCIDIELFPKLCCKGALVCIDGAFATPLNQKALALGADLVLHSATKCIGGHNDGS